MAKTYRLLKDLPDCKAGTLFEEGMYSNLYYYEIVTHSGIHLMYPSKIIENNPEWFELIDNCVFDHKRLNERLQELKEKEREDEIRRLNHQAELLAEEKDYWHNRCLLAEDYIQKCPCDPDIYPHQAAAYKKWKQVLTEIEKL